MKAKRQKHSGAFKAKVAIEALQERVTLIGQLEMERDFLKKKLKETGAMTERLRMVNRKEPLSILR